MLTSEAFENSVKGEIPVYFRCMEINSGVQEYQAETVCIFETWFLMQGNSLLLLSEPPRGDRASF